METMGNKLRLSQDLQKARHAYWWAVTLGYETSAIKLRVYIDELEAQL